MDTHIVTAVSCTKKSCQAISKYQPICQPNPACVQAALALDQSSWSSTWPATFQADVAGGKCTGMTEGYSPTLFTILFLPSWE